MALCIYLDPHSTRGTRGTHGHGGTTAHVPMCPRAPTAPPAFVRIGRWFGIIRRRAPRRLRCVYRR